MQLKLQAHWQPFAQDEVRQPRRSKPVNDRREQHWPQSVEHGKTASFKVTPSTGYAIDKVEGCGDIYTTGAVTRSCWVRASFMKEEDAPLMSR